MKKDVEWLKNEVNELPLRFLGFNMLKQREEFAVSKDDVLELINQLDEPEVLADKDSEPETVADVVSTFWKSYERLKEAMSMEVEELEE